MKSILKLAAVAVIAAPALIAAPANAASHSGSSVNDGASATPVLKLIQRCKYKRINLSAERLAIKMSGYTKIKYLGTSYFAKRCAQFVRFSACKGFKKYKVTVRYINGINRYVIVQQNGICLKLSPRQKLKLKTN